MIPVTELAKVLGTAANAVKRANCVAANTGFVVRAINAVNAAVPNPTPRYSKATTPPSTHGLAPTVDSRAKPKMLITWTTPNSHSARLIPSLIMMMPPPSPPTVTATKAATFEMAPIWVSVKPTSRKNGDCNAVAILSPSLYKNMNARIIAAPPRPLRSINSRNGSTTASRRVCGRLGLAIAS